MRQRGDIRSRNPFYDPLVTELIEDPVRYGKVFSQQILVGETMVVFQPTNVVLLGPQGSGKSMILNLIRYQVLSEWLKLYGNPAQPLKNIAPFLGISINLVRASFHAFGRRSVSKVIGSGQIDQELDAICAGDFLNHFLFREFLKSLQLLNSSDGKTLREWLGIHKNNLDLDNLAIDMTSWKCWFDYYNGCDSFSKLLDRCEDRLNKWRSFLCANTDEIPQEIWKSKSMLGESQHAMGNLLRKIGEGAKPLSLFVIIDQYEVLCELNPKYGTTLQRIVNTLVKARDPVIFYKIGARTYDWGRELRIFGAESRIEVQRDFVQIDLAQILMRNEDGKGWLFPDFCLDVAYRRICREGGFKIRKDSIKEIFGKWQAETEANLYFSDLEKKFIVLKKINEKIKQHIKKLCGPDANPIELRLASAWALQKVQRDVDQSIILNELDKLPWQCNVSWRKERVGLALLQIASITRQSPRYFGWETILYLSGANISAFLLIFSKVWDYAAKLGYNPTKDYPLREQDQSDGIYLASHEWFIRDRQEHTGGSRRYAILSKLGPSIHEALVKDFAISNPGHSGFSLKESDLVMSDKGQEIALILQNSVSWAILEERSHTSKLGEGEKRRKWFLHPLLSPNFAIPYKRVKEPLYADINTVYSWIFENAKVDFKPPRSRTIKEKFQQQKLQIEEQ